MPRPTPEDPGAQRGNRAKAFRAFRARLSATRKRLLEMVKSLPSTYVTNEYAYPTVRPQTDVTNEVEQIIWGEWQIDEEDETFAWWLLPYIELPFRQGALQQMQELNRLLQALDTVTGPINPDTYVLSRKYRDALQIKLTETRLAVKTMGQRTAADVSRTILEGIQQGLSNGQIAANVGKRFDVAKSSAKRLVDTEVSKAYNDSRLRAVQVARDETGVNLLVQHISALLPTTRAHHAARHKKWYTPEAQREWWDEGSNRINCYCVIRGGISEQE